MTTQLDDLGLPIVDGQKPFAVDAERPMPVPEPGTMVGHNAAPGDEAIDRHMADRINARYDAAMTDARSAVGHAIECGRELSLAKELIEKSGGIWTKWLAANTRVPERTDRQWRRIAQHADLVLEKMNDDGALTFADINRLISEHSKPERALDDLETARLMGHDGSEAVRGALALDYLHDIGPATVAAPKGSVAVPPQRKRAGTKVAVKPAAAVAALPSGTPALRPRMSEEEYDRQRATIAATYGPLSSSPAPTPSLAPGGDGRPSPPTPAHEAPLPSTLITVDTGELRVTMTVDDALSGIAARIDALLEAGMSREMITRLFRSRLDG